MWNFKVVLEFCLWKNSFKYMVQLLISHSLLVSGEVDQFKNNAQLTCQGEFCSAWWHEGSLGLDSTVLTQTPYCKLDGKWRLQCLVSLINTRDIKSGYLRICWTYSDHYVISVSQVNQLYRSEILNCSSAALTRVPKSRYTKNCLNLCYLYTFGLNYNFT